jgi:hypothetical protein
VESLVTSAARRRLPTTLNALRNRSRKNLAHPVEAGQNPTWNLAGNGPMPAHIRRMATIVQCNCGAEYRRTEEKFLVPHTGDAVCTVCGAALESWLESTHVPKYELIERPDRKL